MTSCWSKGRNRKYPYYLCDTKHCPDYRKSIRKEVIEGEFEEVLKQLTPSEQLFALALDTFKDSWEDKLKFKNQAKSDIKRQIAEFETKSVQLIDRLVDADSAALVKAYEARLQDMERQKAIWSEKLAQTGNPNGSFKQIYRTAFEFLSNPWKLWGSDRLEDKKSGTKTRICREITLPSKQGLSNRKNF